MFTSKKKRNRAEKKICAFLCIGILLLLLQQREFIAKALFDSSKAVQIDPTAIENSTLIIGTHLIYLHALSDELYQIAQQSASDASQDRIYYKSEMTEGLWYDITDAESMKDITTEGEIVEDNVLRQLYFTHHTKSDGITYDLRTNQAVCIFNIYPIYDLESMPELESLKMQYDLMKESESESDTNKRNLEFVQQFFSTQVETGETQRYGQQVDALQSYYQELAENDASIVETESVLDIMEKLDYARKATVFSILDTALVSLQEQVADTKTPEDNKSLVYELDDSLLTAIGNAKASVSEVITEAQGNMLSDAEAVLTHTEYTLAQDLITTALSHQFAACDEVNAKLIDLQHITQGIVANRDTELTLIDTMIVLADEAYQEKLSKGESAAYQQKAAENASHAALQSLVKQDVTQMNAAKSELQFFIQSKTDRQENELAQAFILLRIQQSSVFLKQIPNDAYQESAKATVDSYVAWLQEQLAKVKDKSTSKTEAESLYEKKAELSAQQLEALDHLNLDTAKKIEAQIQELDEQIAQMEKQAENELTALLEKKRSLENLMIQNPADDSLKQSLAAINADIANAGTDMADGSAAAAILQMKQEALGYLDEADTSSNVMESLQASVEGLSSMMENGSALAFASMKEVYQKMVSNAYMADTDAYEDIIQTMEQTIADANIIEALDERLSRQEALEAIGESLSNENQTAALLALAQYYENTGNEEIKELLDGMLMQFVSQGKGYAFDSYQNANQSFAPAQTVAEYIGYRYLWNDTKKTAILSRGLDYYIFQTFYNSVERTGEQIEYMDVEAAYAGKIYLPASYVSQQFDCFITDIFSTNYSVLVNDTVIEKSQELYAELLEKGGN